MYLNEYQSFVGDSCNVKEEAEKFKNQGYFFGPLGNTMVVAVANALGIQVVIFSSAHHYPLIYITPRVCKTSIPLYVAFNQGGAGHYDAVIASAASSPSLSSTSSTPPPVDNVNRCTCGHNLKHYSALKRCTTIEKKYTSIVLCPCFANGRSCTSSCICKNCSNPNGMKPAKPAGSKQRQRYKQPWQHYPIPKSSLYALESQENLSTGSRTQLEYILVAQIVKYLQLKGVDWDVDTVHAVYIVCTELTGVLKVSWPLGWKNDRELNLILSELEKNKRVFESTCITQLKINFSSQQ